MRGSPMYADLEKILYTKEELEKAVAEMGRRITEDYRGRQPLFVCTLRGALVFFSDLIRHIDLPLAIDSISCSSYVGTESSGTVILRKDLDENVEGRDVLVVEDIIDTGRTLHCVKEDLLKRDPASVKIVTLLDKPSRRKIELKPDYACFTIDDAFVVGYGLDYNEKYRNLPEIGILSPRIYEKKETGTQEPRTCP